MTPIRILLADDHPRVLERVSALLQSSFNVVGTATNGQELITKAMRTDPDVIVADISMPILTGIEAARRLHEAGSRARFVFLTIHSEDDFVQACLAEGVLGYVVKSRMGTDLIPAIKAVINNQPYISHSVSR